MSTKREQKLKELFEKHLEKTKTIVSTGVGAGTLLVQDALKLRLPKTVCLLATDDLVEMTKRFYEFRDELKTKGLSSEITISWHWTKPCSLKTIQTHGLLTKEDRHKDDIKNVSYTGAYFGDGIYVGNNPKTFSNYGSICLGCLTLFGNIKNESNQSDYHTVIGNKSKSNASIDHPRNEYVLKRSRQILPIFQITKPNHSSNLTDFEHEYILKNLEIMKMDYFRDE